MEWNNTARARCENFLVMVVKGWKVFASKVADNAAVTFQPAIFDGSIIKFMMMIIIINITLAAIILIKNGIPNLLSHYWKYISESMDKVNPKPVTSGYLIFK